MVNDGIGLEGLLLHTTYETYLCHQKFAFNGLGPGKFLELGDGRSITGRVEL